MQQICTVLFFTNEYNEFWNKRIASVEEIRLFLYSLYSPCEFNVKRRGLPYGRWVFRLWNTASGNSFQFSVGSHNPLNVIKLKFFCL